jgi:hypothetical protein
VTKGAKQIRLNLLLNHLQKGRWRKLPNQVGLKTALVAEDLGLIESRGDDLRARTYRLTKPLWFTCAQTTAGLTHRTKHAALAFEAGLHDASLRQVDTLLPGGHGRGNNGFGQREAGEQIVEAVIDVRKLVLRKPLNGPTY